MNIYVAICQKKLWVVRFVDGFVFCCDFVVVYFMCILLLATAIEPPPNCFFLFFLLLLVLFFFFFIIYFQFWIYLFHLPCHLLLLLLVIKLSLIICKRIRSTTICRLTFIPILRCWTRYQLIPSKMNRYNTNIRIGSSF